MERTKKTANTWTHIALYVYEMHMIEGNVEAELPANELGHHMTDSQNEGMMQRCGL